MIGDGALTGGMAYEGAEQGRRAPVADQVVLNDNGMSISENVGRAVASYFQRVRVDPRLTRVREELERGLCPCPAAPTSVGTSATHEVAHGSCRAPLFEALGFAYIGPIDGHDIDGVRRDLRRARAWTARCCCTSRPSRGAATAGRGRPVKLHGLGPFVSETGDAAKKSTGAPNYTESSPTR